MKKNKNEKHKLPNPDPNLIKMNNSLIKTEEWYNIQDMMDYLKVSRSTLNRLVRTKQLPSLKLGGTLMFPKNLINSIMQNQSLKHIKPNNNSPLDA
ncbi:helix-turn-helix domain-containing protein [Formosa maritima]|uniref:Helix-turn-helix domain-containing protein n=1 Tax=Formosa maritima TaxID=2592046 RepID=A0A5D0G9C1_9FLAO|nr:helix-turn-helix domain-containing protein [Formosa maritima]TYA55291.1 helix-turn-helix domain-containing protein [Formosa maritima]